MLNIELQNYFIRKIIILQNPTKSHSENFLRTEGGSRNKVCAYIASIFSMASKFSEKRVQYRVKIVLKKRARLK